MPSRANSMNGPIHRPGPGPESGPTIDHGPGSATWARRSQPSASPTNRASAVPPPDAGAASAKTDAAPPVFGAVLDSATRCIHFHSELDIVAIRFACCRRYYPCYQCHDEAVRGEPVPHAAGRWPQSEWSELAILCGACHRELSITEYRQVERCPHCAAEFNPGCRLHAHLYFEESDG